MKGCPRTSVGTTFARDYFFVFCAAWPTMRNSPLAVVPSTSKTVTVWSFWPSVSCLRKAWAPLTFTAAKQKVSNQTTSVGAPAYSFTELLDRLAIPTRNDIRYGTRQATQTIATLATPTPTQRRAFQLLGQPFPIGLKRTEPQSDPGLGLREFWTLRRIRW